MRIFNLIDPHTPQKKGRGYFCLSTVIVISSYIRGTKLFGGRKFLLFFLQLIPLQELQNLICFEVEESMR